MKTLFRVAAVVGLVGSGFAVDRIMVRPHGAPGGPGHTCRWKPGTWSTVVNPPNCPAPSIPLTPDNLLAHCSCAPIQLWF